MESNKWNPHRVNEVFMLSLLGATLEEIADIMGVRTATIARWREQHPEFDEAIRRGRNPADARVAHSLYKSAVGYYYYEEVASNYKGQPIVTRIKRYRPPNPWAAARWLSLRQAQHWGDTTRIDITQRSITTMFNINLDGMTTEELMVLKRLGLNNSNETPIRPTDDELPSSET